MRTFLRLFLLVLSAFGVLFMGQRTAEAAVMKATSLAELTRGSDLVVRGKVASREVQSSPDGGRLFTIVTLEVADSWKGAAPATVRIQVPGGEKGGIGQVVHGAPGFADGEEVVVFLRQVGPVRKDAPLTRVVSLAQGKFDVVRQGEQPMIVQDLSEIELRHEGTRVPTPKVEPIPMQRFEAQVKAAAQ